MVDVRCDNHDVIDCPLCKRWAVEAEAAKLSASPLPTLVGLVAVAHERRRQDERKAEGRFLHTCADPELNDYERLAILAEEFGEVAREVLTQEDRRLARDTEGTPEALRKELAQVAAVCVAWLEAPR